MAPHIMQYALHFVSLAASLSLGLFPDTNSMGDTRTSLRGLQSQFSKRGQPENVSKPLDLRFSQP
jgi:hypothetical protein